MAKSNFARAIKRFRKLVQEAESFDFAQSEGYANALREDVDKKWKQVDKAEKTLIKKFEPTDWQKVAKEILKEKDDGTCSIETWEKEH
jgi:hypothetical protein